MHPVKWNGKTAQGRPEFAEEAVKLPFPILPILNRLPVLNCLRSLNFHPRWNFRPRLNFRSNFRLPPGSGGSGDRGIQISVFEYDIGRFAAQFKRNLLQVACRSVHD